MLAHKTRQNPLTGSIIEAVLWDNYLKLQNLNLSR